MVSGSPQIHMLRSPDNFVCFAHAHDEASHHFLDMLLLSQWSSSARTWEGNAVFPIELSNEFIQMAKYEGITVIDGGTLGGPVYLEAKEGSTCI